MLSQITEKLNTPTDYESFIVIEKNESLLVRHKHASFPLKSDSKASDFRTNPNSCANKSRKLATCTFKEVT